MWGFTRAEQRAILFLLVTFALGSAVLWYRRSLPPPPVDSALLDTLRVYSQHSAPAALPPAGRDTVKTQTKPLVPVNLNTATMEDLIGLPGVGEVLAKRILDYRAQHGKFARVEELEKVKGFGKSKMQALRDHVVLR